MIAKKGSIFVNIKTFIPSYMKHTPSLLAFAAIALFCASCAPVSSIQSGRQKDQYNVNDMTDLIGDTSRIVHGEQNVLYSISNDASNLYVTLMIADPRTQNKVLRNGFTLWIDTTGGKKQTLGVAYPLPSKEHKKDQSGSKKGRDNEQDDMAAYKDRNYQIDAKRQKILTMLEMDLIGYQGKNAVRVPAISKKGGISVALLVDSNGALQYHAIIPFAVMHYNPALHTGPKSKPLTIALTTNKEETKPAGEKGGHSGGGDGSLPGAGGGMGGGGMRGGGGHGGGGGGGSMDPGNDPVDVWMHVKLSW